MNAVKHCFAGGNTSIGFYSLFNEAGANLERLYIIFGSTSKFKSAMVLRLGEMLRQKGVKIEYFHALNDTNDVEGLIVPELRIGVIDGNSPHSLKPSYPGVRDIYIDLGDSWISTQLKYYKADLFSLIKRLEEKKEQMYQHFASAKKVHDRKEKIYVSAMNFSKANQIADQLNAILFADTTQSNSAHDGRHFFLGASTSNGAINYIDNITADINKRYIIKGRSGSGKSTLMRKVAKKAEENGFYVEYYHCSFDPHSLDMILIPMLGVAMLDGTSPHVIEPTRDNDEVIDMFLLAIDPIVEVNFAKELSEIDCLYRDHIRAATTYLQDIMQLNNQLEAMYRNTIDQDVLSQLEEKWISEIVQFVEDIS